MRPSLLFFSPLALNLFEVDTLKLRQYPSQARKIASCTPAVFRSSKIIVLPDFCKFKLNKYTKCVIYF